jgi:hypothetical protein
MNNFTIKRTPVSKGTKTRFELFCNGVLIGSRTTARPYKFATITKRDQAGTRNYHESQAASNRRYAAEMLAIHNDEPGARAAQIRRDCVAWDTKFLNEKLAEGAYLKWHEDSLQSAVKNDNEVARLSAGPLPEFDTLYVYSWNSKPTNYPNVTATLRQVVILNLETLPVQP